MLELQPAVAPADVGGVEKGQEKTLDLIDTDAAIGTIEVQ
jgi:hypothetical protein